MARSFKGPVLFGTSRIFKSTDRRLAQNVLTRANVNLINSLWADAINVFISTAVKSMAVDTSMSVGSFTSVARSVGVGGQKIAGLVAMRKRGEGQQAIASQPAQRSRQGYTDIDGKWVSGVTKNGALGARLGQRAYKVKYVSPANGVAFFEFEAVTWQHDRLMPSSLITAGDAMTLFINLNFTKYVNPVKALRAVINL